MAHELGHVFIGWHDDVTLCKIDNEYVEHNMLDIQEKEANVFASELLMPTEWIKRVLENSEVTDLESIIRMLCSQAKTSVMACFYALENAMNSGNVLMVYRKSYFPKRFVTKRTCEVYLNGKDFQETCGMLAQSVKRFQIGNYIVLHYKFMECPLEDDINARYMETKELLTTLEILSDGMIFDLLHCMKSILKMLDERYIIYTFVQGEQSLLCKSDNVELYMPYNQTREQLEKLCKKYEYEVEKREFGENITVIAIKEPDYIMPLKTRETILDSKMVLEMILSDIYDEEELKRKRMSISGIVGSTNSMHKGSSKEVLYDLLHKKMRREEFFDVVEHGMFDEFVFLKASELAAKNN